MKGIVILALVFSVTAASAQTTLYMPRDVKAAFKKGTRSPDGRPGVNYWQNRSQYNINITARPPGRLVSGTETITYFNNSNDTIRNPVFKLFINIHKPGAPRGQGARPDYLTDGVQIDKFVVNGQDLAIKNNPNTFTNLPVRLPRPLMPKDSVKMMFEWHYQASIESGREGMIDSTTLFLAYFYPRVAVFDDYNGWDKMPFTDDHEFYSDFNDYSVTINVPNNFIVWGTGTLQRPENCCNQNSWPVLRNHLQPTR